MATTGSGYVRPAMPIPTNASPNHCRPQPSILRRPSQGGPSPFASPLSSPVSDKEGFFTSPFASNACSRSTDTNASLDPLSVSNAGPSSPTSPSSAPPGLFRRESQIHFAPLPELSEEDRVRRSSSISLGVAARSGMLSAQNGGVPRKVPRVNSVSNSDWAAYKRGSVDSTMSHSSDADSNADITEVLAAGVRSFWNRVRSSDASSKSSTDGAAAAAAKASANPSAHTAALARLADRRGSAPVASLHKPGQHFHATPSPLHALPETSQNPSRVPSPPPPDTSTSPPTSSNGNPTSNGGARRVSAPVGAFTEWTHQRKNSNESFESPKPSKMLGSPVRWREGVFDAQSPRGLEALSLTEEDEEHEVDAVLQKEALNTSPTKSATNQENGSLGLQVK